MSFGLSGSAWAGLAVSAYGAHSSSQGAKKAAQTQQNAAGAAGLAQNDALNRQLDMQEPFRQTGLAGNRKLAELLGISQDIPADQSKLTGTARQQYDALQAQINNIEPLMNGIGNERMRDIGGLTTRRDQARQQQEQILSDWQKQNPSTASQSADYGSLLKPFSATDLAADPVYNSGLQFGMDQGIGALNARSIQAGNYDSGAAIKNIAKYANDYGTTKAGDAYSRFNTNQKNIFDRLSGISGTAQQAANQATNSIQNFGNTNAGLITDAGSARSAGIVAGNNAWGGTISNLGNMLSGLGGRDSSYDPDYMTNSVNKWLKTA